MFKFNKRSFAFFLFAFIISIITTFSFQNCSPVGFKESASLSTSMDNPTDTLSTTCTQSNEYYNNTEKKCKICPLNQVLNGDKTGCVDATASKFCSGAVPSNATLCASDNLDLTSSLSNISVLSCTARKCEYSCNDDAILSGGSCVLCPVNQVPNASKTACVSSVYSCTGTTPLNTVLCSLDNLDLTANLAKLAVSSCTARKCEYRCNEDSYLMGSSCSMCSDGQIANSTRTSCVSCKANEAELSPGVCTPCGVGKVVSASKTSCEDIKCSAKNVNWGQTLACSQYISTVGTYGGIANVVSNSSTNGSAEFKCTESGWTFEKGSCYSACVDGGTYTFAWHNKNCQGMHTPTNIPHSQKYTTPMSSTYAAPGATGFIEHTCYDGKPINPNSSCKPDSTILPGSNCSAQRFYWKNGQRLGSATGADCWGDAPSVTRGTTVGIGNKNVDTATNTGFSGELAIKCNSSGTWEGVGVIGCTQLKGIPQNCVGPTSFEFSGCKFTQISNQNHASVQPIYNTNAGYVGKILLNCNDGVWWQGPMYVCARPTDPKCADFNVDIDLKQVSNGLIKKYNFKTSIEHRIDTGTSNTQGLGGYIFSSTTDGYCSAHVDCKINPANAAEAIWDTDNVKYIGSCTKP